MDGDRFDALTRLIGSGRSRRGLLKSLAGAAAGVAAAGLGRASAAHLRSAGNSCRFNSDCASGLCVQESRARAICHCRSAADCPAAGDPCHAAVCQPNGSCGTIAANAGALCAAAPDACAAASTCDDAGNCVAGGPIDCDDGDPCTVDSCNPVLGCVHTPAACPACSACDSATGSCAPVADGGACGSGRECCGGGCVDTNTDAQNCGGCGVKCSALGVWECGNGICCQGQTGGACSASVPCCSGAVCNEGGVCCLPAGRVTCHTDNAAKCCSGICLPEDPNCVGRCPGACG